MNFVVRYCEISTFTIKSSSKRWHLLQFFLTLQETRMKIVTVLSATIIKNDPYFCIKIIFFYKLLIKGRL